MNPSQLSRQLRTGTGGHLSDRRVVVASSLVAMGCMALISAYAAAGATFVSVPFALREAGDAWTSR